MSAPSRCASASAHQVKPAPTCDRASSPGVGNGCAHIQHRLTSSRGATQGRRQRRAKKRRASPHIGHDSEHGTLAFYLFLQSFASGSTVVRRSASAVHVSVFGRILLLIIGAPPHQNYKEEQGERSFWRRSRPDYLPRDVLLFLLPVLSKSRCTGRVVKTVRDRGRRDANNTLSRCSAQQSIFSVTVHKFRDTCFFQLAIAIEPSALCT